MTTHEVLVAARNLIDRKGWCQGHLEAPDGRLCALGAVFTAAETPASAEAAHFELIRALDGEVTIFNDGPSRTKEQVLAKFDEAIALTAPLPEDLDLSELAEALA